MQYVATGTEGDTTLGRLSLEVVRDALHEVMANRGDDSNLRFLEGTELYAPGYADELPLPDGLHPGPEAHVLIGERFADLAFGDQGAFARGLTRPGR